MNHLPVSFPAAARAFSGLCEHATPPMRTIAPQEIISNLVTAIMAEPVITSIGRALSCELPMLLVPSKAPQPCIAPGADGRAMKVQCKGGGNEDAAGAKGPGKGGSEGPDGPGGAPGGAGPGGPGGPGGAGAGSPVADEGGDGECSQPDLAERLSFLQTAAAASGGTHSVLDVQAATLLHELLHAQVQGRARAKKQGAGAGGPTDHALPKITKNVNDGVIEASRGGGWRSTALTVANRSPACRRRCQRLVRARRSSSDRVSRRARGQRPPEASFAR